MISRQKRSEDFFFSYRREAMEVPSSEKEFPLKNTSYSSDSLWIPNSSPSSLFFHDSSMAGLGGEKGTPKSDGESDDGSFHRPEKKRRLKPDQVRVLEEIFEVENKLEACRKQQLAEELGLHPRQIAIWFQNRRARCKSKLLEKEYDSLKAKYDNLKSDHDAILAKNQELKNEVHQLTAKLRKRKGAATAAEKTSSPAKSDVIDSPLFEKSDTSQAVKTNNCDFSGDEDDESMSFLQPLLSFPKLEAENCDDLDLQPNSCNLGFPVQYQGTWLWRY